MDERAIKRQLYQAALREGPLVNLPLNDLLIWLDQLFLERCLGRVNCDPSCPEYAFHFDHYPNRCDCGRLELLHRLGRRHKRAVKPAKLWLAERAGHLEPRRFERRHYPNESTN